MRKDMEKLFDKIILAIRKEKELRQGRKLLLGFFFLLIISIVATPLSLAIFIARINSSGIYYFLAAGFNDLSLFFSLWRDMGLIILESLPVAGLAFFALSLGLAVFTLRLFLYKKKLLLNYLINSAIYKFN